jgi:hypothetical protein
MRSKPQARILLTVAMLALAPIEGRAAARLATEKDLSPNKPKLEEMYKPKSIKRIVEDLDIITNSEWTDKDEFAFINGVLIRAPLRYARPIIMDFSLYPKMSSALKTFKYDPKTETIEIVGEAGGLRMHSWVKVDQRYWDEIAYEIVRGDMVGFKVKAYLWDTSSISKLGVTGKTIAGAKGLWPGGKTALPSFVATIFKPLSEVVIGVATKNFRSYIEEEYKKQTTKK